MDILKCIILRYQIFVQHIVAKIGLTIKFSQRVLDQMDKEVADKKYSSRSELITEFVTVGLNKEARIEEIKTFLKSPEGQPIIKEEVRSFLASEEGLDLIKSLMKKR